MRRRGGEKGQGPRYAPCPRRDRKHSPHHHGPLRRSQRPCRSGVTMTPGFGCADLNGDPAVHPFGCLSGRLYGGTGHVYASWKPWRRRTLPWWNRWIHGPGTCRDMAEHALMQVDGHQSNMTVAHHPPIMVHHMDSIMDSRWSFTDVNHDGSSITVMDSSMLVHDSHVHLPMSFTSWNHTTE